MQGVLLAACGRNGELYFKLFKNLSCSYYNATVLKSYPKQIYQTMLQNPLLISLKFSWYLCCGNMNIQLIVSLYLLQCQLHGDRFWTILDALFFLHLLVL